MFGMDLEIYNVITEFSVLHVHRAAFHSIHCFTIWLLALKLEATIASELQFIALYAGS